MKDHVRAALFCPDDKASLSILVGSRARSYATGSILIDFLEMDYNTFSIKYLELMGVIGTNRIIDTNEFDVSAEKEEYDALRKIFEEVAHFCFDRSLEEQYKDVAKGSITQRYSFYTFFVNPTFENSLDTNLVLDAAFIPYVNGRPVVIDDWKTEMMNVFSNIGTNTMQTEFRDILQPEFCEVFHFSSLTDVIYFELLNVLKGNIVIKECENCNRYFVPAGRNDAKYCKPCEKIGAIKKYEKEIEKNPIKKAYRMEYKKRYARVLKGKLDNSIFFEWSEKMKSARDQALKGDLVYEKFVEMLKEQ